jgi:DNA-binding beta-propeller fold protein YncE
VIEAAYNCPSKGPHLLASSADGTTLYISAKEGDVSVFDTETRVFTAAIPVRALGVESGIGSGSEGITLSPDGRSLIAIDNSNGDLRVFDSLTNREIDRVPMTMQTLSNQKRSRLGKLMFSPDGRHLVVTGYAGGCAWLVDPNDLRRQTLVPVAKGPMGMAFTPDGGSVIVSSHDNGLLTRIDLEKQTPVTAYDGGAGIEVLTFY